MLKISEGRTLAKTYECKFIEVSAGLAHHVDELLVGILAQVSQVTGGNISTDELYYWWEFYWHR